MHDDHQIELARMGVTQISHSRCGMIHLGIGPVTVKLSPEAFAQLAKGVMKAHQALCHPAVSAHSGPSAPVPHSTPCLPSTPHARPDRSPPPATRRRHLRLACSVRASCERRLQRARRKASSARYAIDTQPSLLPPPCG